MTQEQKKRAHTNQIRKYMTPRVSSASTYVEGKEKDATTKRKNEREITQNEKKIQKILSTEYVHQVNIEPKHRKNRAKSKPTDTT